ncbi:MAG TPA: 50S ribosomal protein L29 [Candidatus Babeliales bacterium]|jgi:ribosomal protein L29|nr:50S ribosomal protein L29 [Candidatus Babeliales bacterium]
MKITDVRKMSTEDLTKQVPTLQTEIVEMRRRLYSGEMQNVRVLRSKRKDLARVYTVLGEKLQKEDA